MILTRRALTSALSVTGVAVGLLPTGALASGTGDITSNPVLLPDMALGAADAAVTMIEYASITCPHCAAFNQNVFPKIKAAFIDTGKIRFVFREFPLDPIAAASNVLSRCVANGDAAKFFEITDVLFRQDWSKVEKPREIFNQVGARAGLDDHQVSACLKDDAVFDKIVAGRVHAAAKLKVDSTPTFFINGDKIVGMTPFEEFDKRINALLDQ